MEKTFWYYKNLDCSKKENRIILVKKLCEVLDVDKKPEKDELKKICKNLSKRFSISISNIQRKDYMDTMVTLGKEKAIIFIATNSPYELFSKFIITVKMKYG